MTAADETDDPLPTMGPWVFAIVLWFVALALAPLVQLYFYLSFITTIGRYDMEALGFGFRVSVFFGVAMMLLKAFVMGLAAYLMIVQHKASTIKFAYVALLLWFPVLMIVDSVVRALLTGSLRFVRLPPWMLGDIALVLVPIAFLLLSKRVASVYGTRARAVILSGVPQLWMRLRGRAPLPPSDD